MENVEWKRIVEEVESKLNLTDEEKEAMLSNSRPPKREEKELDAAGLDRVAQDIVDSSRL